MITLSTLQKYKQQNRKFSCLTCYDAWFAHTMMSAKIDTILVGDSLGMVVQGNSSTLPVTVADMVYHTRNVAKANHHALIMTDLPFMSYASVEDAVANARAVMQAGAHVVKLEGDARLCSVVSTLAQAGTPTCVHMGLTPQSVNVFGGYKVQAKAQSAAEKLLKDAKQLQAAGAALLLLECVPAALAKQVTQVLDIPVIGIGAGADTDGQVLVMHDMLGVVNGRVARFVHDFLGDPRNTSTSIEGAFALFHESVVSGAYPTQAHQFN